MTDTSVRLFESWLSTEGINAPQNYNDSIALSDMGKSMLNHSAGRWSLSSATQKPPFRFSLATFA